jgi:hypothetical protein
MKRSRIAAALILGTPLLSAALTGCGSPGPSYYLASNARAVELVQWNPDGSGTYTYDSINSGGTASTPDSLNVDTDPVTVKFSSGVVTLSGFFGLVSVSADINSGGQLVINNPPDSRTGEISQSVLSPSDASSYNQAVQALDHTISADNAQAAAQVQAQQTQQADTQAEQTASNDLATLNNGPDLSADVSALGNDMAQTNTDLNTVKQDQAAGQGQFCNGTDQAASDADTVDSDADTLQSDLDTLTSDIGTVRSNITTVQDDLKGISADNLPAPQDAAAAITAARHAIRSAISQANSDISAENSDTAAAYQNANSLATGSCSGSGPEQATPISTVN